MQVESQSFPRSCRLGGRIRFEAVYAQRQKRSAGPLTVYRRSNALPFSRLGLSISRRAGSAVRRNRLKRHLREAFRRTRNQLPMGYDWVVVIRGHPPMEAAAYERALLELTRVNGIATGSHDDEQQPAG